MTVEVLEYGIPLYTDERCERINLADLCISTGTSLPHSYVAGKTAMRDAIMDRLDCSAMRAERLVDRMESAGLIQFEKRRHGPLIDARWEIARSH